MGSYEENYLAKRPQHLCHMCGKCCRVVTTSTPYAQLKSMAESGDKGATDFLSLFEPYPSIEAARNVDADVVDNIINRFMVVDFCKIIICVLGMKQDWICVNIARLLRGL